LYKLLNDWTENIFELNSQFATKFRSVEKMDLLTLVTIGVCCYLFYKWATANHEYFVDKGVKFIQPIFLVGSNASLVTQTQTLVEMMSQCYSAFPAEK
jgi:hypothetical protein